MTSFYFLGSVFLSASTLYKERKMRKIFRVLGIIVIVLGALLTPDFFNGFKEGVKYWMER